jgi:hypothetical protein
MEDAQTIEALKVAFDKAIANAPTPEVADRRRLLKAYFTDPAFRKAMEDHVAAILGVPA